MSRKPETDFIRRVHKHLPAGVYHIKMRALHQSGIPDCFYDGNMGSLWVEYKYLPKIPVRTSTPISLNLSFLQAHWLNRNNNKVLGEYDLNYVANAIIIGSSGGGVLIKRPCEIGISSYNKDCSISVDYYRDSIMSVRELATFIEETVTNDDG